MAVATTTAVISLQLPNLHAIPGEDRNQQAVPLHVVTDIGGTRNPGDDLRALRAVEPGDRGVRPARHDDLPSDDLDAVEPTDASGDDRGCLVTWLPRHDCFATERHDDEPPPDRVERNA